MFSECVNFFEDCNRYKVFLVFTKTGFAQSTTLAMNASLVTVAHLYQVNGKTVPPGESQVVYDKDWGYV